MQLQKSETQVQRLKEPGAAIYDKRTENLPKRNICFEGHMLSFKYFNGVENQLRFDLSFKPSILVVARAWLKKVFTDTHY